ncbi:hypothetical protein [Candidatus Electronema sp. PJ]|uniref:hypothetical protein n=1 Tax=Candidatus Electronema sp. PJ TaxID=3401572 RepID=UPI003AA83011
MNTEKHQQHQEATLQAQISTIRVAATEVRFEMKIDLKAVWNQFINVGITAFISCRLDIFSGCRAVEEGLSFGRLIGK